MTIVKKVGPISLAKLQGVGGVILGLIMGILFTVVGGVASQFAEKATGSSASLGIAGFGAASIIIFPIMYGIIGFVSGLVSGWIYNVVAGWVGGIQIELQQK